MRVESRPGWYKKAPAKINKDWDPVEKEIVYSLRIEQGLSRKEISRKLKIDVTKIDNQLRIMKKVLAKRCFVCNKKLSPEEQISSRPNQTLFKCKKCTKKINKYKKILRAEALKKGLCGICRKRKVIPGKTACKTCLSAWHRRQYEKGICAACGKRPIKKGLISTCAVCAQKRILVSARYRAKKHYDKQMA